MFAKQIIHYRKPLLAFIIIITIYWFGIINFLTIPRLKVNDLFLNLRYKLTHRPKNINNIVIVGIDDSTYYTYGKKWPWERNIFVNLIYKLKRYNPAVIGIGLAFLGESTDLKASDFLLAEAFKDAGNIILASYFDKEGRYVPPYKDFQESILGYGFTNKPEDKDGVIRETSLFEYDILGEDIIDFSFDVKLVNAFLGGTLKDIKFSKGEIVFDIQDKPLCIPAPKSGIIPLNYSARMTDFKVILFEDVVNGNISSEDIKGKIVLVGAIGEIFRERNFTPSGQMPAIGIIANSVLMLVDGNFIYKVPLFINIFLLLIAGLIVSILTSEKVFYYGVMSVLVILACFFGISLILVINNISWDFFSIPLVILAICLTNGLSNYASLLFQSLKIKRLVVTDILTGLPTRRYFLFKLNNTLKNIKSGEPLSLVLFSIDNFQLVVSVVGVEKANRIVKDVGQLIAKFSRKTRGVDFISRCGEVEFCCVLHKTPEKGAMTYANRIMDILKEKITLVPLLILSAGIADIRDLKDRSSKLFVRCAEEALNKSRREGGNRACVYNPEIDKIPTVEYEEEKEILESDLSYVAKEFEEKYKEMAILVNKVRTAHEEVIKSEKLSAIGKVAATIHHDLSKPIGNLRSSMERVGVGLSKIDLPELATPKKFVKSAIEETIRLEQLMERLKNLYRPMEKEIMPIQVSSILEEMLNLSRGQIIENKIRLTKGLDPNIPMVLADSGDMKQVFLNLIQNAIESMGKGGELKVNSLVSKDMENMIEVQIIDTGCGISPENLDKIFEAFFTTRKEEKGAGLGLYASLEIVKSYGGTIKVESIVNKGSIFKVYLPFKSVT